MPFKKQFETNSYQLSTFLTKDFYQNLLNCQFTNQANQYKVNVDKSLIMSNITSIFYHCLKYNKRKYHYAPC